MNIETTLKERGSNYGSFESQAELARNLKDAIRSTPRWDELESYKIEAIDMILHKISRIVNGDSNYLDSWVDLAGYAVLVEKILIEKSKNDRT